jgi:hypothetical protein
MEKQFIIFYEHTEYGYYTTTIDGESIHDALTDFSNEYAYNEIYGIMEIK